MPKISALPCRLACSGFGSVLIAVVYCTGRLVRLTSRSDSIRFQLPPDGNAAAFSLLCIRLVIVVLRARRVGMVCAGMSPDVPHPRRIGLRVNVWLTSPGAPNPYPNVSPGRMAPVLRSVSSCSISLLLVPDASKRHELLLAQAFIISRRDGTVIALR